MPDTEHLSGPDVPKAFFGMMFDAFPDMHAEEEDRAAEHWGVTDMMKMMQQLGLAPEVAPAQRNVAVHVAQRFQPSVQPA